MQRRTFKMLTCEKILQKEVENCLEVLKLQYPQSKLHFVFGEELRNVLATLYKIQEIRGRGFYYEIDLLTECKARGKFWRADAKGNVSVNKQYLGLKELCDSLRYWLAMEYKTENTRKVA